MQPNIGPNLTKLETKLDKILEELPEIKADLRVHMKRSDMLEALHQDLHERLKPLEKHVSMWAGAGKLFATVLSVIAVIAAILKVLV